MSLSVNEMIKSFFVICHNIRSRENVGSIFRTADAFGITKIYLTGYTPPPPHEKISKTALGAEKWIPWEKRVSVGQLLKDLKLQKIELVALEQSTKSVPLHRFRPHCPLGLIVGNEARGLSESILKEVDRIVEIPMRGRKESLNVAVAFGIAAYHIARSISYGI